MHKQLNFLTHKLTLTSNGKTPNPDENIKPKYFNLRISCQVQ